MSRADRWTIAGTLLLVAFSLRPHFDLTGGDFPFYLQAKAFADLRPDVEVPAGARLPTMMASRDGKFFAHYSPGTSLLLAPFQAIGEGFDRLTGEALGALRFAGWEEGRFAVLAVTGANLVFAGVLVWLVLRLGIVLGMSPEGRRTGAWLAVVAAPVWYLSGHPNTHVPSTMLTLAATVLVFESRRDGSRGRLVVAGLAGALSLVVRPLNVLVLLPLGLYVVARAPRPLRSASAFGSAVLVGPVLILALNAWMVGSPFENPYQYSLEFGREGRKGSAQAETLSGFSTPLVEGLPGMLVGAISGPLPAEKGGGREMILPRPWTPWERVRGLLWLMPMLVFAVPGLAAWRRRGLGAEAWVVGAQLVLLLLAYSKWFFWYANPHTPLPSRFLCDTYPAWGLAVVSFADEAAVLARRWVGRAVAWTVSNQAFVTLCLYLNVLTGTNLLHWPVWLVAPLLAAATILSRPLWPPAWRT